MILQKYKQALWAGKKLFLHGGEKEKALKQDGKISGRLLFWMHGVWKEFHFLFPNS